MKDAAEADAALADASEVDGAQTDAANLDGAARDAGPSDGSSYGFMIRVPVEHPLPCANCPGGTIQGRDMDYVCTLRWRTWDRVLYVQATPESYGGFGVGFVYRVDGAFLSDRVTAQPVTAVYDWGGNHHNDSITLSLPEQHFRYFHSSFGFGFRACQPMDCLTVSDPGPGAVIEDGCTRDRTVPVICVEVQPDGSVPELVDQFARCPGDT